jgi:YbgC/YbaW family acyl-CoA thioester hydrolase
MSHTETFRVRWNEVDAQGIVFNGHYLSYLDLAGTGYWRAMALPYPMAFERLGVDWVLRSTQLEFLLPARFDELLHCEVRLLDVGRSSLRFGATLRRGSQALLEAELRYVMVSRESLQPEPVPEAMRAALQAFEDGQHMLELRVGRWDLLGSEAQPIRAAVFVREQGIPADLEWDGADAGDDCVHAVAFNRLGQALGTGRLLEHVPGTAKIGRMAVLPAARGTGVGAQVLEALMRAARERGYRQVLLHAQASAVGFYRRAGFSERGAPFEEAGIGHQEMVRAL